MRKPTSSPAKDASETAPTAISQLVRKAFNLERYKVHLLPVSEVKRSPENDELYGATDGNRDSALDALTRSVERLGLEEPLILTRDNFILSGHRRYKAITDLGWDFVPVRFASVTRDGCADYHRLLAQYNPQRVKTVATTLAEKFLNSDQDEQEPEDWASYVEARSEVEATFMEVNGSKFADEIGPRQTEFIEAAKKVIESLRQYWPLTIRQIHYKLLNDPPLTQVTKKRNERWRYKNDVQSYSKLSDLLVAARYTGVVPFYCIHDATRETHVARTYDNLPDFIEQETDYFLRGYTINRQQDQPHHIEVLLEKNTLVNTVKGICEELHVPMTPLRGYAGPSVWKDMEKRFNDHDGAEDMILIIMSDHDPEGFDLADDAFRSLRDNHGVDIRAVRCAVTREQIEKYNLRPNPAKEDSKRFAQYVQRTGTTDTYECEALEPEVLRHALHDAISSVVNVEILQAVQEREATEIEQLNSIRQRLGPALQQMLEEGDL